MWIIRGDDKSKDGVILFMRYGDKLYCHNVKIRDNKMNCQCLTQGNCVHVGIQKSEGCDPLLDVGRDE